MIISNLNEFLITIFKVPQKGRLKGPNEEKG